MNYYDEIQKICMFGIKHELPSVGSEYSILRHLFEIMGEKRTNSWIEGWLDYCDEQDEFVNALHKNLRQDDVFDKCDDQGERIGGNLDMILYNFIHISNVPFKVFDKIYENHRNND